MSETRNEERERPEEHEDLRDERESPETSGEPAGSRDAVEADEVEILRSELMRLQEDLKEANARFEEMKDRFLRSRAELDNYRKRAATEAERARDSGLDSAVLPALVVFDDLKRALDAADGADPAAIVPGVQSVLATLERSLEALGVESVGHVGDAFDPDLHEALTSLPTDEAEKSDTIAEVFQVGFQKGGRLIRPARVVVYQS
jgi:molecular chaperone GrpE